MEFELAYGKEKIKLELSDNFDVDIFAPLTADKYVTFECFKAVFTKEGGNQFLSGEKLLFIVNDGFRNTPTSLILKWLDIIDTTFINRVHFIISTGTHKEPTENHYQSIFGKYYPRLRNQIIHHNARDYSSMVKIGVDKSGADVWVNKIIFEYDKVCLIGSVEPHYFAGFTGGRKSIFPGLTDFTTIERNHNLANSLEAAPLRLKDNPVAEHLSSLMSLLDFSNYFSFQTVLDAEQQLASIFMGDVYSSFEKAAAYAKRIYAHEVAQEYDMVISELLPP
ncbi:MAG: lactate racemase domain-containing protein, partial [Candidatus Zixiibacteriota bacterium]